MRFALNNWRRLAWRLTATIGVVAVTLPTSVRAQADDADRALSVTLRKRFSVGGAADDRFTPNMLFARDIAVDTLGRLYLLDRSQNRVLIIDARGKLLKSVGRAGGGPGELRNASSIGVSGDGALVVGDFSKRALVRFDARGEPLPEVSTRGKGTVQGILAVTPTQMTLDLTYGDTNVVVRRGTVDERLAVMPPHAKKPAPIWKDACGLIDQSDAPLLSAQMLVASNGRTVVVNEQGAYAVTLHAEGAAPARLVRKKAQARATIADVRRIVGDSVPMWIGKRPCSVKTADLAATIGVAAVVPAYASLAIDRTKQVWARRTAPTGAATSVDLFGAKGYLGTATMGRANPVAFLADGAMVSLERDDDDAPVIVVYDVSVRR